MRVLVSSMFLSFVMVFAAFGQGLKCDMTQYKESPGLTAACAQDVLAVTWTGEGGSELRARYAIERGQPVVRDLAIRKPGAQWSVLGQNLTPEYHVVSGLRRFSKQQGGALIDQLGMKMEDIEKEHRWYAYHDAPLEVPGKDNGVYDLPRKPEEIRRASSTFNVSSCKVKTDGASLEVNFPGLSMGIFSGSLQFTVYRGTNLLRMDAIAKTDEDGVAYKFDAGLKGFSTDLLSKVTWQDTGGNNQKHEFAGIVNETIVPLKAKNRVLVAEGKNGSIATFPMPHKYFWPRQIHKNLGTVWYRKDADKQFGMGVRQAEHEESESTGQLDCFALYNAPPGSMQRMGMYYWITPDGPAQARDQVMAFTHNDRYKEIPGYKTFTNHWHFSFTNSRIKSGSLDTPMEDLMALKAMGLNIAGLADRVRTPADQKIYYEAAQRSSDKEFLALPWDELSLFDGQIGGHQNLMLSKPVYFTNGRKEGEKPIEIDPVLGKVYHLETAEDLQTMLEAENAYWNTAHPRTKSSAGYPDAYWDKPFAQNDHYLGVDFTQAMGVDLSDPRMAPWRVFNEVDVMNNMNAGKGLKPKNFSTDVDTYNHFAHDDIYPNHQTVYLKLDKLPLNNDWSSVMKAFTDGYNFGTTGEVLIPSFEVQGTGNKREISVEVDWTFPLNFIEVVTGDGKSIFTQEVSAKDTSAFGKKRFSIPFDATGKKWVRLAVWDSAGNPGFTQPMWLK